MSSAYGWEEFLSLRPLLLGAFQYELPRINDHCFTNDEGQVFVGNECTRTGIFSCMFADEMCEKQEFATVHMVVKW